MQLLKPEMNAPSQDGTRAPLLRVVGARKRFRTPEGSFVTPLDGIDLTIRTNEFLTLLGPSGCGKTTLLKAIAGFEDLDSGDIHLDGDVQGDIACGSLTLGAQGCVKGNVSAQRATIAGAVEGTVVATELVIEKTARIQGDVAYESISIETGARVDGRLSQKGPPAGELKLVSAGADSLVDSSALFRVLLQSRELLLSVRCERRARRGRARGNHQHTLG